MDSEDLDYSAQKKKINYVAVLVFFYSSIVSHVGACRKKMLFMANGKQIKHYMTSKG